jgi:nicotinate-nucleotide adenylyltransferase
MMLASPGHRRVGLLFGSFNPIHIGHLILAEHFATRTDLAEVWLVVSPQNPFKVGAELLPETQRLQFVEQVIEGNARLRAEAIEFELRPSYTIATLDALRARYPDTDFVLLMGADNLPGLPRWQQAERLLTELDIYVYPRPGTTLPNLAPFPRVQVMQAPLLDISATYVRESLRVGRSIRYLVPDVVEAVLANKRRN